MSDSKRTNLHAQENFYRPILEYRSASILLICSVSMLYMGLSSDGLDIAPIVLFTSILLFFAVPLSLQNSSAIFDGSLACIQATFHVR